MARSHRKKSQAKVRVVGRMKKSTIVSSTMNLQCPLAHLSPGSVCGNGLDHPPHLPSIRRVNEHIRKNHLAPGGSGDQDSVGVHYISQFQYEAITAVTKKHRGGLPRDILVQIRRIVLPAQPEIDDKPFFNPSYDQLKAAAETIGNGIQESKGAFNLLNRIASLAREEVIWLGGPTQQQEHIRRACQIFPFIIDAIRSEGYVPPATNQLADDWVLRGGQLVEPSAAESIPAYKLTAGVSQLSASISPLVSESLFESPHTSSEVATATSCTPVDNTSLVRPMDWSSLFNVLDVNSINPMDTVYL